jgi:hypothetical protein
MSNRSKGSSVNPERKHPAGWPYARDPFRPYDFGNQISIPSVVIDVQGRPTVVRLDPRDPNYHLVSELRKAG